MAVVEGFELVRDATWRTTDGRAAIVPHFDEWYVVAWQSSDLAAAAESGLAGEPFRSPRAAALAASLTFGCSRTVRMQRRTYKIRCDETFVGHLVPDEDGWYAIEVIRPGVRIAGRTRAEALRGFRDRRAERSRRSSPRGESRTVDGPLRTGGHSVPARVV